jgi:hypothetical protein
VRSAAPELVAIEVLPDPSHQSSMSRKRPGSGLLIA